MIVDGDAVDLLRVGAPAVRAVVKKGRVVAGEALGPQGRIQADTEALNAQGYG